MGDLFKSFFRKVQEIEVTGSLQESSEGGVARAIILFGLQDRRENRALVEGVEPERGILLGYRGLSIFVGKG